MWKTVLIMLFLGVVQADAKSKHYDVYILTGQSNSLGTTALEGKSPAQYGPGENNADKHIAFYWSNVRPNSNDNKVNYYGDSNGKIKTIQMQQGNGANPMVWGPEVGFARKMYKNSKNNILIIKASRGGGGNSYWIPKGNKHHMWLHLRDTVDAALKLLAKKGNTFTIKGFVYLQGESNSKVEAMHAGIRLNDLRLSLKNYINTCYSGTADNMYTVIGEIAGGRYSTITTEKQRELADSLDSVVFVSTKGLTLKKDKIHFGRDSKLEIGKRFAKAFIEAEQIPEPASLAMLGVGSFLLIKRRKKKKIGAGHKYLNS